MHIFSFHLEVEATDESDIFLDSNLSRYDRSIQKNFKKSVLGFLLQLLK